jgi:phosphoribosylamine-glycine ligase
MANFLIVSPCGESLMLLENLRSEGHSVVMYEPKPSRAGDGIVFKTGDLATFAEQADAIIFDDNGEGELADDLRSRGLPVWCGGAFAEKIEYDRSYGMKVFKEYGIPTPETFEVSSVEDVRSCLASEFGKGEKVVIKISGEGGAGTSFSFCAPDTALCMEQVDHWVDDGLLPAKWTGIIQRFVEGIEVSVEAWWGGESWSMHNITLEEKKLLSGDLGPSVGCAFNTIALIDPSSRLFKQALDPLSDLLKKSRYVGQIDTNSIVDLDGVPHALEFTPRPGYDATPTLVWGGGSGYGNAILAALGKQDELQGDVAPEGGAGNRKGKLFCGVRVHIPPYPFEAKSDDLAAVVYETCYGTPIEGHAAIAEDFYLYDACYDSGRLVCAGTSGIVGIAFGAGDTAAEAAKAAYRVAERIRVPNKGYRALDGWKRAASAIDELSAMKMIRVT